MRPFALRHKTLKISLQLEISRVFHGQKNCHFINNIETGAKCIPFYFTAVTVFVT